MNQSPRLDGVSWAMIGAMSLVWGSAFLLIEIGLRSFPPVTLAFLRFALAAPFMVVMLHLMKERLPTDAASWRRLFVLGALNAALPMMLFFWGQQYLTSGYASVLNATTPLWGVLVAHVLTQDEKATPLRLFGVLLGLAGMIVMVGPDALGGLTQNLLEQIACLISTVFYGFAAVYGRKLGQARMTPLAVATGHVITAALLLLPIMLIVDQPWTLSAPGNDSLLAVIALAIPATAIPYLLYFKVIDRAGASNAMLVALILPVVAIFLGIVFLDESLTSGQIAGSALIALGLLAIDGRFVPALARRAAVP
jgi:drug/metabolite transporter (DMT)-like permease